MNSLIWKGIGYGIGGSIFACCISLIGLTLYYLGREEMKDEYETSYEKAVQHMGLTLYDKKK